MRPSSTDLQGPSTAASRNRGSSKALSGRLDTGAGLEPHPITKRVWTYSLWATLIAIVACASYVALPGNDMAFQTRHVSKSHELFQQDCARCHTTWGPARRLVGTFTGDEVWSVSNEKCEACHRGPIHHANQWPAHDPDANGRFLSCAKCHREHRGDVDIAAIADQHCVACHGDLSLHGVFPEGEPLPYAGEVDGFGEGRGHPEFALIRRLLDAEDQRPDNAGVLGAAPYTRPVGSTLVPKGAPVPAAGPRWQDPGRIRFNHFAHLSRDMPVRDDLDNLIRWGERIDQVRQTVGLQCADCHRPDEAGKYMQPIDYESHCRICHPIRFDTSDRFRDVLVPHAALSAAGREKPDEAIAVLVGFLTEQYARAATEQPAADGEPGKGEPDEQPGDDAAEAEDDPKNADGIPASLIGLPGRPGQSLLTARDRENVRPSVDAARNRLLRRIDETELARLRGLVNVMGKRSQGGCLFCHLEKGGKEGRADGEDAPAPVRLLPTNIPRRWMPHGEFDHARHRELSCHACHQKFGAPEGFRRVDRTWDTGDVLMPSIDVCRKCHAPKAPWSSRGAARSGCVECHRYHDHSLDTLDMGLDVDLEPMEKKDE